MTTGHRKDIMCDLCEEEQALSFCGECMKKLCDFCKLAHTRQKQTKKHSLAEIGSVKLLDLNVSCSLCNDLSERFCQECDACLCTKCSDSHHQLSDVQTPTAHISTLHRGDNLTSDSHDDSSSSIHDSSASKGLICEQYASSVCDLCDEEQALMYCDECQQKLGDFCHKAHTKQKLTKNHHLTAIETPDSCNVHCSRCDEFADKFCFECDVHMCSKCAGDHHKFVDTLASTLHTTKRAPNNDVLDNDDLNGKSDSIEAQVCIDKCQLDEHKYLERNPSDGHENNADNSSMQLSSGQFQLDMTPDPRNKDRTDEKHNVDEKPSPAEHGTKTSQDENRELMAQLNNYDKHNSDKTDKPCSDETDKKQQLLGDMKVEHFSDGQENNVSDLSTVKQNSDECNVADKGIIEQEDISTAEPTTDKTNQLSLKASARHVADNQGHVQGDDSDSSHSSKMPGKDNNTISAKPAFKDGPEIMIERPGKPTVLRLYTDSVDILWTGLHEFRKGDFYQVRIENTKTGKWESQDFETNSGKIRRLQQGFTYVFKVRLVYSNGDESKFSEKSEEVTTHTSYASKIVSKSVVVTKGTDGPDFYRLPMKEKVEARTKSSKKFDIVNVLDTPDPNGNDINEKTIMLVGATGTGKSTFVNSIANYVMGVMVDDTFRFTVMQEEDKEKQHDQAGAITEIITCYSFNPNIGTKLSYRLNVVDTPGFGDIRGPERDVEIVEQIQHLFDSPGEKGIQMIDAICIFVKAADSRLTPTQRYIFNAIMSMFGNDIAGNMCTIITFDDGDKEPPVMSAVRASGLLFGKEFTFNNLAFIADPKGMFTSLFWDKSLDSFSGMFKHLDTLEAKSMQLTKDVLKERQNLTVTCQNLVKRIKEGISALQSLKAEIVLFEHTQNDISDNKNYTCEVTEPITVMRDLPVGIHVTNCLNCNRTCHENCKIADDDEKHGCVAMDDYGYCKQCPKNCYWKKHKNRGYALDVVYRKVQKTYEEMLKRYLEAKGKQLTLQRVVEEKRKELETITADIESMLKKMKNCNNRLKEISLRPNPLGLTDQLDLMILTEEAEGKEGYLKRIEVLKEFRERAAIDETVQKFQTEESSVRDRYNTLHVE